jgi:hypothetical protein
MELTKSQIQKIISLNECLKSNRSEKIKIGVIGSVESYDEWFSIIHLLGVDKIVEVIYLDSTRFENGHQFNIISIDEAEQRPQILISHNPKTDGWIEELLPNENIII